MASMVSRFESSGFLTVETSKIPVDNEETLHRRIMDACQSIRSYPGICGRMRRPMMRRVETRPETHEEHFEHVL
jgi:hypothetical protein